MKHRTLQAPCDRPTDASAWSCEPRRGADVFYKLQAIVSIAQNGSG